MSEAACSGTFQLEANVDVASCRFSRGTRITDHLPGVHLAAPVHRNFAQMAVDGAVPTLMQYLYPTPIGLSRLEALLNDFNDSLGAGVHPAIKRGADIQSLMPRQHAVRNQLRVNPESLRDHPVVCRPLELRRAGAAGFSCLVASWIGRILGGVDGFVFFEPNLVFHGSLTKSQFAFFHRRVVTLPDDQVIEHLDIQQ